MTDGAPIPHGALSAELPAVIPAKPLFTGRRLGVWPVLFTVVLVSAHYAARFVRRFVWFDCPPHWPLSIFNPRGPHHVVEWAALAATVGGGAWVIHFLRRRGFPLPYVGGFGLLLILLSNAIQGVPKGFFNPIAGGRAPEQYYHDALHVSSVATRSITNLVCSSPCCVLLAASTGTKAWLKAPSANRRRNRLGMRKATLKASVMALAPKVEAISSSRTRPVMRETKVRSETVEADLKSDTA